MITVKVKISGSDLSKAKLWDKAAMAELLTGTEIDFRRRTWTEGLNAEGRAPPEGIDWQESGALREGLTNEVQSATKGRIFISGVAAAYADDVQSRHPFLGWGEDVKEIGSFQKRALRLMRQAIIRSTGRKVAL